MARKKDYTEIELRFFRGQRFILFVNGSVVISGDKKHILTYKEHKEQMKNNEMYHELLHFKYEGFNCIATMDLETDEEFLVLPKIYNVMDIEKLIDSETNSIIKELINNIDVQKIWEEIEDENRCS